MTEETKLVKHNIVGKIEPDEDRKVDQVEKVVELLSSSPKKIETIRNQSLELDVQIQETEKTMVLLQNNVLIEINGEQTTEGKDVFTSDVKRKTELTRRLSTDEVAQNLQTEIDGLKYEAKGLDIELGFRRDEFSSAKRRADIIARRD